ncbi:serine hydrolase [Massilia sp. TS11]|uniref:serine hydrolase domain-containing protein n=1 Tax=Massilia sp. TS11 TaxID=2908003 RepID=UPI001EDC8C8D|nr:serine hydrolase domain-containing protein [Massilia sp. TS11]MCG2584935.1 beta-lactamase family protein [Massilia sp. TS11]
MTYSAPLSGRPLRRRLLLAACAAVIGLSACGGNSVSVSIVNPPPLSAVGSAVAQLMAAPKSYPAALVIQVSSANIEVQVQGVQRVGGVALASDASFAAGSLTKAMTATLAGVLVQEGKIGWNSRVLDVLPELAAGARAEYAAVTLTDLLAHRGGIFPAVTAQQVARLPQVSGTPSEQRLQLARWALAQAPSVAPRQRTEYSNGGYVLAAAMLERAAGQAYEAMLQNRVFTPLGASVQFGAAGARDPWGHSQTASGSWLPLDPASADAYFPPAANPAGGARLNGQSLARWLRMHLRALRGQSGELLSPATATYLHTVVQDGMALGWQAGTDLAGGPIDWHDGSDDVSYFGLMAVSRSRDVAAAVLVSGVGSRTAQDVSETTARLLQ